MEDEIFLLYYDTVPATVETIDLTRVEHDFRKVYLTDDGQKKLAIKHTSNGFVDRERIESWTRLIDAYNKLGIYCPRIVPNKNGQLVYHYAENGRDYWVYAEEFAKYQTADQIEEALKKEGKALKAEPHGRPAFYDDLMRSIGKVAAAGFDFMSTPSAYRLLEPFDPNDKTDEGTECAELFKEFVLKELPQYTERMEHLMKLFYANQSAVREIYYDTLPTSCFQADTNSTNVLLDEDQNFVGLIDFNLSGREVNLNYILRAAMWRDFDDRTHQEDSNFCRRIHLYDEELDRLRMENVLRNLRCAGEFYTYSEKERAAFPVLFRYMNSFWWHTGEEIEREKDDPEKVEKLFDWLERQMTRDDVRLP